MVAGRALGWLLLAFAVAAAGYEAALAFEAGQWRLVALGALWYEIDAASLNAAQAGIQRYVAPWLWEPVITSILLLPAWAVFGVPGLLLAWLCRARGRRHRRRRH